MFSMASQPKAANSFSVAQSNNAVDQLKTLLIAHISAEDLAGYSAEALQQAATIALAALRKHQPGSSIIEIESQSGIELNFRELSTITVINDNMPFLFDSVIGEISETVGEPTFVAHPVLQVSQERDEIQSVSVSLIHIHVPHLSEDEAAALKERLANILRQVHIAVQDWKPMLQRLDDEIKHLRHTPPSLEHAAIDEALAFLEWLRDENFTFLGMRDFHYSGSEQSGTLERADIPGLGILSDPDVQVLRRGNMAAATTPEIRAFLHGPEPLIITKANTRSRVHRRTYLDYIGVKIFDSSGALSGELRIVGLFTSTAFTQSVMLIPYLRSKAKAIISASGFSRTDHSGKALINVLETFPRDELFQIELPRLRDHAEAILSLDERPRVKVLYRIDQFDRFVSVILFVPRDRYNSEVCERLGHHLETIFQGRVIAFYPAFPDGPLTRVHFIIGRTNGKTPRIPTVDIEEVARDIIKTWGDRLSETAEATSAEPHIAAIASTFPENYRNNFDAASALIDAGRVQLLSSDTPILIDFYRRTNHSAEQAALKIFHYGAPVALSQRVPLLENMGFRVISEQTFELGEAEGKPLFMHDMELEAASGNALDLDDGGALFEQVFLAIWRGEQDNDRLNTLAQTARMRVEKIAVLRVYSRYLQQAGLAQSQGYIADTLNRFPAIAANLYRLFKTRLDPRKADGSRQAEEADLLEEIETALERVPSIDDDTIIRRFVTLIRATLRTNHFRPAAAERSIAIKFDPHAIEWLPQPRPWREIFVYGPEVEGVHLRFGPIARGGLRWSDRAQDYRTEVLGLVKAQQVKNSVIVPVGAKGGFYPRRLPISTDRQVIFEAGRAAYINFISTMLSITDNLVGEAVVTPEGVIRQDETDPYFVVAADKGTATFSDTANEISQAHDFWLDDAFASGGSAGYDHKEMGITARGAWEAVKRHFREMNRDIQAEPFTAIGVGDMSGDVFGNGMLLSPQTKLVAAFDHRDIFIDPTPDSASSLTERKRLYDLPRSSWQDYDKSKLSVGGMIVSRTQKQVTLTPEAAAAIGMETATASPAEIISAILQAPVDLLWFGGIGTYARASTETNLEVGDRGNDAIRVMAKDIRAKVIGEGANLGMTQRSRIEFNLIGGRCNSDAIDNSAGVNSSDIEVNIKIALASAMRSGKLDRLARNALLAVMTDEVAQLVLANNYHQPLAISLIEQRGVSELPHQARMMTLFEGRGLLDRAVEFLPGPEALAERQAHGEALTRAEIGVLLAYAKIVHFDELVASEVPDHSYFETELFNYFPEEMHEAYADDIRGHRLHREIIATVLINDIVNRGGATFITQLQEMTGLSTGDIVEAYIIVRDGFGLEALFAQIDALDTKIDGQLQLSLYQRVRKLIVSATAWQLKNGARSIALSERTKQLREGVNKLTPLLLNNQSISVVERLGQVSAALVVGQVPEALANHLVMLDVLALVPDIIQTSENAGSDLPQTAHAFFTISEAFQLSQIETAAANMTPADYYDGLALLRALDVIDMARRNITVAALTAHRGKDNPAATWLDGGGDRVHHIVERLSSLTDGGDITVSRLTVAAGLMADMTE